MQTQVREVPKIQQQARAAASSAIHYGYVAYQDIQLLGAGGIQYFVQPSESPYFTVLPCRQLIPFTNIMVAIPNDAVASDPNAQLRGKSATAVTSRDAGECAKIIDINYHQWGFVVLEALTGYSEADADQIFFTIQPFYFKLKDIVDELSWKAEQRILQTETYTVEYEGEEIEMRPLRGDLRDVAERVRALMETSAKQAERLAEDIVEKTTQSLTSYFAGGDGKRRPDPLDKLIFAELDRKIPQLLTTEAPQQGTDATLQKLAELIVQAREPAVVEAPAVDVQAKLDEIEAMKLELAEGLAEVQAIKDAYKPIPLTKQ